MADFPGKVNTQTSSSVSSPQRIPAMVDMDFIRSIPGILLATEIVSWKNYTALSMLCIFNISVIYFVAS